MLSISTNANFSSLPTPSRNLTVEISSIFSNRDPSGPTPQTKNLSPLLPPPFFIVRTFSWHPGPVSHELVADMLFMHYGKVFLSAIDRLEEAAPGLTAAQLRQKRRRTHDPQREDAPAQSSSDSMTMITLRKAVGLGPDNKNVGRSRDGTLVMEGMTKPPPALNTAITARREPVGLVGKGKTKGVPKLI